MKLSINNFKTIRELKGFNFNSINIISGVNSSGKTSFIQFLLMLKQTVEAHSAHSALIFDGNRVKLGDYDTLVYKKDASKSMGFELQFDKKDIDEKFQPIYGIEEVSVKVSYAQKDNSCVVSNIMITYNTPQMQRKDHSISFVKEDNTYKVDISKHTALFGDFSELLENQGTLGGISFFPTIFLTETNNPNSEIDGTLKKRIAIEVKTKEIQDIVSSIFTNVSYIGPLREEPQDLYSSNGKNKYIGSKGEYAAQFFEEEANKTVEFFDIQKNELKEMLLSNAVKYWICDVFNLAKDIKAEKYKDSYVVKVVNHYDVESTIRQVGFGISQVLPIIVEGLRMNKNGILILEQPEIHLHPKVQSLLFDFIYSLSLTGKRFVIETHSDHFITRMRRRVAESSNNLSEKINLVFVEERESEHLFRKLNLDDMGTFDYFPKDFVEQTEDYGAIIMAQANKAKAKK